MKKIALSKYSLLFTVQVRILSLLISQKRLRIGYNQMSYKGIVLLIVSFALFMEAVDTTIINTAIPVMAYNLHVNAVDLKIALISYLLSLAVFIPISGWIADKFGIKKVFISAIIVFTLSS